MITVEIERDKVGIEKHFGRWNEIFECGNLEASTSHEWSRALLTSHLNDDTYRLFVIRDSHEIVGFVPLVLRKTKKAGLSLAWIQPLSEYYGTHSDLLLQNMNEEMAGAFVSALYRLGDRWDVFRMNEIVETNPMLDLIECYLKKRSIPYEIKTNEPSFYLRFNGTFQEYLNKRSDKFRNYLKRMQKKIREQSCVEYVKYQGTSEWEEGYRQLLYVDEQSWKHDHGTAITSVEKQNVFYQNMCRATSETGRLHISILRMNNEPTAYNLGFVKGEKYYYLKTSYVEKYRTVSPATVLRAHLIEDLIHEGIQEMDFAGEPYTWEKQWTDEVRWHKSISIYNNTLMAKAYGLAQYLRRRKNQDIDKTVRYKDSKNIIPEQ